MIGIAARSLRERWVGFVGTWLALALGVALVTITLLCLAATLDGGRGAPTWFTHADAVVVAAERDGAEPGATIVLGSPPSLTAATADRIAHLDGVRAAVPDRRAPIEVGGRALTARGWSLAPFQTADLVGGRPPAAPLEVVLPAGTAAPGGTVRALTVDGPRELTVSGVLDSAEPLAYVVDGVADAWAGGRIDAVALRLAPGTTGAVREVAGVRVLTGADRSAAEPDLDAGLRSLGVTLLADAAAVATLAAAFVVAGTFSFSVAQRRRELALLRACGATPRQVRRTVSAEALLVGVTATAAGAALGRLAAPAAAGWLADAGLAPAGLADRFAWAPVGLAALVGLLAAGLGVTGAARRAGAVRPVEAMRDAVVDRSVMGPARWVGAALLVATAAGVVPLAIGATSGIASAYLLLVTIALLLALALLAPVLVPPLLAPLAALLRNPPSLIAITNVRAAVRRTASTAAPVIITFGLAAATLTSTSTISATTAADERERVSAEIVVEAAGPVGLDPELLVGLGRAAGVRGVESIAVVPASIGGDAVALTIASAGVDGALRLPLVAGTLTGFDRPGVVALDERTARDLRRQVGEGVELRMPDGTTSRLVVAAVLADAAGVPAMVPWATPGTAPVRPGTAYVSLGPGADAAAVLGPVRAVAAEHGATAGSADQVAAESGARDEEVDRLAVLSVIGLTVTYTAISIATTFLMSTAERRRELGALRLAGATGRQLIAMVAVEVVCTVLAAALLAALVSAVVLLLTAAALAGGAPLVVSLPWAPVVGVGCGCLVIAGVAGLVPALRTLRRSPVAITGSGQG